MKCRELPAISCKAPHMLDSDKLLMKRALELARRGAGLASPNPLVGALVVNEGRVVGEGYHVYKQVKHAEIYAIEAAGALAKNATLYCNLEPCCHYGRTPPCTEAVIEAKIARVVIAVKDPNPDVNGHGVDELRQAGIEVEVGLLEDRATIINESYFKLVRSRMPFVHGVIEWPAALGSEGWKPSKNFVQAASECDALIAGYEQNINDLLISKSLKMDRHRPLVIVADAQAINQIDDDLRRRDRERVSLVAVAPQAEVDTYSRKVTSFPSSSVVPAIVPTDFEATLVALARAQIASVFNLPGVFDSLHAKNFSLVDKLTMVIPKVLDSESDTTLMSIGDLEFGLEEPSSVENAGFTELTGYPSVRGAA